jgi:hypothetical protein
VLSVNVGSGAYPTAGWLNVDTCLPREGPHLAPNVLAAAAALPLRAGSVGRLFACHLLEHVEYFDALPLLLAEFRRVLAPAGELCVIGPDIERTVLTHQPQSLVETVVAWPREFQQAGLDYTLPWSHKWTPTALFTERALAAAGFGCEDFSGRLELLASRWPVIVTGTWQLGFICRTP